jgi:hypothetical protein
MPLRSAKTGTLYDREPGMEYQRDTEDGCHH